MDSDNVELGEYSQVEVPPDPDEIKLVPKEESKAQEGKELSQEGRRLTEFVEVRPAIDPAYFAQPQIDIVNPKVPGKTLRVNELCTTGAFAGAFNEFFFPLQVVVNVSLHADRVLRMCGLIRQTGETSYWKSFSKRVIFDNVRRRWKDIDTNAMLPLLNSKNVIGRVDYVPAGIISVVGTLDCSTFETVEEKAKKNDKKEKSQKEIARFQSVLKKRRRGEAVNAGVRAPGAHHHNHHHDIAQLKATSITSFSESEAQISVEDNEEAVRIRVLEKIMRNEPLVEREIMYRPDDGYAVRNYDDDDNDIESIIDIADPQARFLSKNELLKYTKHYLSRGVIFSAIQSKASIIVSGIDDLARQLGHGYAEFCDVFGVKTTALEFQWPKLIGVNNRSDVCSIDKKFSAHMLLETPGQHILSSNAYWPKECKLCGKTVEHSQKHEYCALHPDFLADYSKRPKIYNSGTPLPEEILNFKKAILDLLSRGYQRKPELTKDEQPPNRQPTPIALVLIGGDGLAKGEVRFAVSKGWPVLVVEGTGGFADEIFQARKKVQELSPDAGADEFRSLLGGVDPVLGEVILNGKLVLIPSGTPVDQFQRLLNNSLKGNEILHQAWRTYAYWRANEAEWRYSFQLVQLAFLMLGTLATLCSVTETFLLLFWESRSSSSDMVDNWDNGIVKQDERFLYLLYSMLHWLIIIVPITLTLLHTIIERTNPWAKVAALRLAASGLLKEIYMYRTKTHNYSEEAIRKHSSNTERDLGELSQQIENTNLLAQQKIKAAQENRKKMATRQAMSGQKKDNSKNNTGGEESEEELRYNSREELLGLMIVKHQSALASSSVKEVTLYPPPMKSIPPRHILITGDSGFTDLTPDDYVSYRLIAERIKFETCAIDRNKQYVTVLTSVLVWTAAGTALAALAAYGLGYLQAWVAFTTALVNSLNRFLDLSRLLPMTELANSTALQLSDVERWWTALGATADSHANRSKLVLSTENILQSELEGSTKQLQKGEEEEKQTEEEAEMKHKHNDDVAQDQALKARAKMREMGIEALTAESIEAALVNPRSSVVENVKKQLLQLNDKMGGVIRSEKEKEETEAVAASEEEGLAIATEAAVAAVAAAAATVATGGTVDEASNSGPIAEISHLDEKLEQLYDGTTKLKTILLDEKLQDKVMKFMDMFLDNACVPAFSVKVVFDICNEAAGTAIEKTLSCTEIIELGMRMVINRLLRGGGFPAALIDIVPQRLRYRLVTTLSHIVASSKDPQSLAPETICQLTRDPDIKAIFMSLVPEIIKCTLTSASVMFVPSSRLFKLLLELGDEKAYLNIEEAYDTKAHSHEAYVIATNNLRALEVDYQVLTKEEILNCFPPELRIAYQDEPLLQLSAVVRQLFTGSTAGRAFGQSQIGMLLQREQAKKLFQDEIVMELFAWSAATLNQIAVNNSSKSQLMRLLKCTELMTDEVADKVEQGLTEAELKDVLSWLQYGLSNSYAGRVSESVGDMFTHLDVRCALSASERENVIRAVSFVPKFVSFAGMSKNEILNQLIPTASARQDFEQLSDDQLKRFLSTLLLRVNCSFADDVWRKVQLKCQSPLKREIIDELPKHAILRLVAIVEYFRQTDLELIEDCPTFGKVLVALGDGVIAESLLSLKIQPGNDSAYAMELKELIFDVFHCTRDCALTRLVTNYFRSLPAVNPYLIPLQSAITNNLWKILAFNLEGFHQLQWDDIGRLLGLSDNEVRKLVGCCPVKDVRDLLMCISAEFQMTLPYALFEEVANWCRDFDLRDLIVDCDLRMQLPQLLACIRLADETHTLITKFDGVAVDLTSDGKVLLGTWHKRRTGRLLDISTESFTAMVEKFCVRQPIEKHKETTVGVARVATARTHDTQTSLYSDTSATFAHRRGPRPSCLSALPCLVVFDSEDSEIADGGAVGGDDDDDDDVEVSDEDLQDDGEEVLVIFDELLKQLCQLTLPQLKRLLFVANFMFRSQIGFVYLSFAEELLRKAAAQKVTPPAPPAPAAAEVDPHNLTCDVADFSDEPEYDSDSEAGAPQVVAPVALRAGWTQKAVSKHVALHVSIQLAGIASGVLQYMRSQETTMLDALEQLNVANFLRHTPSSRKSVLQRIIADERIVRLLSGGLTEPQLQLLFLMLFLSYNLWNKALAVDTQQRNAALRRTYQDDNDLTRLIDMSDKKLYDDD